MFLKNYSLNSSVREKTFAYLQTKPTFDQLRLVCLGTNPPFNTLEELIAVRKEDEKTQTKFLQNTAIDVQRKEDHSEEEADSKEFQRENELKENLKNQIQKEIDELDTVKKAHGENISKIEQITEQISRISASVENNSNPVKELNEERETLKKRSLIFFSKEQAQISKLNRLQQHLKLLNNSDQEKRQLRAELRKKRAKAADYTAFYPDSLTPENLKKLEEKIAEDNETRNKLYEKLVSEAKEKSQLLFLDSISSFSLEEQYSPSETEVLRSSIKSMQEYLKEEINKQHIEQAIKEEEEALKKTETKLSNEENCLHENSASLRKVTSSKEKRNEQNTHLGLAKTNYENRTNLFGFSAMVSSVPLGVVMIPAFLLFIGVIAMNPVTMPIILGFVSIAAAITLTFCVVSFVSFLLAKQTEQQISANTDIIQENNIESVKIQTSIDRINKDLPPLKKTIEEKTEKIAAQQEDLRTAKERSKNMHQNASSFFQQPSIIPADDLNSSRMTFE